MAPKHSYYLCVYGSASGVTGPGVSLLFSELLVQTLKNCRRTCESTP